MQKITGNVLPNWDSDLGISDCNDIRIEELQELAKALKKEVSVMNPKMPWWFYIAIDTISKNNFQPTSASVGWYDPGKNN